MTRRKLSEVRHIILGRRHVRTIRAVDGQRNPIPDRPVMLDEIFEVC